MNILGKKNEKNRIPIKVTAVIEKAEKENMYESDMLEVITPVDDITEIVTNIPIDKPFVEKTEVYQDLEARFDTLNDIHTELLEKCTRMKQYVTQFVQDMCRELGISICTDVEDIE